MMKISIKREQSQAGLSFAERKNFRPKVKRNRLLLLLVLLMTAATGAWATDVITVTWSSGDTYENNNSKDGVTLSGATIYYDGYEWLLAYDESKGTFTTELGNFTKIEITGGYINGFSGEGWSGRTWTGNAAAVPFGGYITDDDGEKPWTITFTIEPASSAAAGYTVSVKDGVKDADKWTITPNPAEEGQTVTLQYNGRLKVKGVKATSDAKQAKPAATVTTAPTGAAIVGRLNTNSTALVSGGVADGGTLWYAVTTTNTKPTSTAGFSDAVPTAKDITASGKVYVWYYVKGDDTHSDSEIAATAIEVPVADIVWDATNISDLEVYGTDEYVKEGVKLSGNADVDATWNNSTNPTKVGINFSLHESGGFTFTAPTGKAFTKIEMMPNGPNGWDTTNLGTGWAFNNLTVTWTGSAASTVKLLTDVYAFNGAKVTSIAFYLSE